MTGPDHRLAGHILRNMSNVFPGATEKARMRNLLIGVVVALISTVAVGGYVYEQYK